MRACLIAFTCALLVLVASFSTRRLLHDRTPTESNESWIVSDPDSLYHARRVERVLEEGLPVADHDEFLNSPDGALIPWPPYYEILAATLISPFAPADRTQRHGFVEQSVARLPLLFGVLTSLLAFLAARSLAGNLAGTLAGLLHALCLGSIVYSCEGNGDHHAFISLCSAGILWGLSESLQHERLARRRYGWGIGALLGAVAGFAIGSWVAALILVLIIDAVFAWLLFSHARKPRAGLARFGFSFHLAALVVLTPAILQSPWKNEFPWMVVNLSWFHFTYLSLGALVFLPLLIAKKPTAALRFYPWWVGLSLAVLAGLSATLDVGPIAGIREGFAWVSRQDSFMGAVAESRPLLGKGAEPGELFAFLGWQILLLPLAWGGALLAVVRKQRVELLPWVVAAVPLAVQAAGQARFADALSFPAAVLVAWGTVRFVRTRAARVPIAITGALLLGLALLGQLQTLRQLSASGEGPRPDWRRDRASRELCDWIREHSKATNAGAVLANWNRGHEIEWAAGRPSVATNFGSYVGEEGFLAPARFFLSEDEVAAEAILRSRDARFVMLSCFLSSALPGWILAGDESWKGHYFELDEAGAGLLRRPWFEALGGQLLNGGHARRSAEEQRADSLDFVRLVHASPIPIHHSPIATWRGSVPYGWIWEWVPGAAVQLAGPPGAPGRVEIELEYTDAQGTRVETIQFLRRVTLNESGRASVRVPYATLDPNGDGRSLRAGWSVGSQQGPLLIRERDVLEGLRVVASD